VLAVSADSTAKAASIDAAGYLAKPFEYSKLLDEINRILDGRRLAHLDRMASLGTLAAGIAHEINNPLTYVISNLQLLEEELPLALRPSTSPEQLRGRVSEIAARLTDALDGTERIKSIVGHVKTFSRAGDGHTESVDVRVALDSALEIVAPEIRQKARLVKDYRQAPLVRAGSAQLGQVFLNMLINACHAVEGEPQDNEIRVSVGTASDGGVVIEFTDTGVGIRPEVRHRIFDPFFTTKPMSVGTGLGLSICHGIVHSLGGSIAVLSEVGQGTTFRIMLPPAPGPGISPAHEHRANVLVVDDEPRVAEAMRRVLAREYNVTVVSDGQEALELLTSPSAHRAFDVVLCDVYLPGTNGIDIYEAVSRMKPELGARMLFMTGGTSEARGHEFADRMRDRLLEKPIDINAIRSTIRTLLERG
jgi:signal transduction histidine kinase/CheY-like chemotaxis protein